MFVTIVLSAGTGYLFWDEIALVALVLLAPLKRATLMGTMTFLGKRLPLFMAMGLRRLLVKKLAGLTLFSARVRYPRVEAAHRRYRARRRLAGRRLRRRWRRAGHIEKILLAIVGGSVALMMLIVISLFFGVSAARRHIPEPLLEVIEPVLERVSIRLKRKLGERAGAGALKKIAHRHAVLRERLTAADRSIKAKIEAAVARKH